VRTLAMLALAYLLGSAACAGGAAPPAATAPTARAPEPAARAPVAPAASAPAAGPLTSITVAYSTTSATNSLLQLAHDRGIFRENGLEVEAVYAPGNAGPAAVIAGQAQGASVDCAALVSAVAAGSDLVLMLTTVNRMGYMLMGGPNAPDGPSLRGKRLAVSRLGAASHISTKFMVKELGLDPDQDVSYLQVGNTPERMSALLSGNVDATILSVDEGALLGDLPGMRVILDMSTQDTPYCGNAVVTTRQYAREHPDTVRRFTRALVAAIIRFKTNRAESLQAVSTFTQQDDMDKVERIWAARARMFPERPYPDPRGVQFVIDELAQIEERVGALTPAQVIDDTWVRELDQSGYIDQLLRAAGPR
jgi:NitT/TauT family transport system substrate-binding protein